MGADENKTAFRRTYKEVFNQGHLAVADEVIAPDFVDREEHPGNALGPFACFGAGKAAADPRM
jgi:hypothetical protein